MNRINTVRDNLNISYDKCNKELANVKELLSDDKAIQEFTGLKPIEKVEPVIEEKEVKEEETSENTAEDTNLVVENEIITDSDDVDGDLII